MNYGPIIFAGILTTVAGSWWGSVLVPRRQLSGLTAHVNTETQVRYPQARAGQAQQGAEVYRSLGCIECHTQQVRETGSDLGRHWGQRRTVARDFVYDQPPQLGTLRLGPDLANYGERFPTNQTAWVHLYQPRAIVSNSICPSHPFLFTKQVVPASGPSAEALPLPGAHAVEAGWEVVPRDEARQLMAYLRSLKTSVDLPEAALPKKEVAP